LKEPKKKGKMVSLVKAMNDRWRSYVALRCIFKIYIFFKF
jgi:hypothetical protein